MRTPTDPLAQTAAIPQGNGNTIIQIVGDGNTVMPGRPHLRLTRYLTRRVVRVELDWLSPYCRSTALIGREHELEELQNFLDDPRPTLVRTLAGPAGRGKTRLALVCAALESTREPTRYRPQTSRADTRNGDPRMTH